MNQNPNKSVALDVTQISYTEEEFDRAEEALALAEHQLVMERALAEQRLAQQRQVTNNPCRFLAPRKAA